MGFVVFKSVGECRFDMRCVVCCLGLLSGYVVSLVVWFACRVFLVVFGS